jgi:hypothetical protein
VQIIPINSENRLKAVSTICGQNTEFLMLEAGGTNSYHSASIFFNSISPSPFRLLFNKRCRNITYKVDSPTFSIVGSSSLFVTSGSKGNECEECIAV